MGSVDPKTTCDMTTPNTPPSILTTSNKMEHLSSQAAPIHVFDGPIKRSRAKKLHQEVHVLLCEIPFINDNYILPKLCMLLLLSFTTEDDKNTPRLNYREVPRRVSSAPRDWPHVGALGSSAERSAAASAGFGTAPRFEWP
jgi:hypothetical protein